jgi:hypothetical protein
MKRGMCMGVLVGFPDIANFPTRRSRQSAVVFQISYVGDCEDAERFVGSLSSDPELGGMVHCNLEKLDQLLALPGDSARNRSVSGKGFSRGIAS